MHYFLGPPRLHRNLFTEFSQLKLPHRPMVQLRNIVFFCLFSLSSHAAEKVGLIQYDASSHFADYDYNLKQLTQFSESAIKQGTKVIVFPEGALYGYAGGGMFWCKSTVTQKGCRDVKSVAEVIPGGPTTSYFEDFSKRQGVTVFFQIPEWDQIEARFYTTVVATGPSGYLAKYRKRILYYIDEYYADPGVSPTVVKTPLGSFGVLICADGNDERLYLEYKKMGVNRIILPMDWDEAPVGPRAAKNFFMKMSQLTGTSLYVSDNSKWDGTGAYFPAEAIRRREGLKPDAIGIDGVSLAPIR